MRISLCVSLGIHAAAFGLLGLAGKFLHPADLPEGDGRDAAALTFVAIPDEPGESPPATKHPAPAIISVAPAKPAEILKPQPPAETIIPVPAHVSVVKPDAPVDPVPKPTEAGPSPAVSSFSVPDATVPIRGDEHKSHSPAQPDDNVPTPHESAIGVQVSPDFKKNPKPEYPLAAKRRHQEGLVILRIVVSAQGRPKRVELKQSSGFPLLDKAAIEAVNDWEFDPARIGAVPIESEIEVPVRFTLAR